MAGGNACSIAGLCGLVVFGWSVDGVLRSALAADTARDLDVVELFSGVGAVHRAAQSLGLRSAVFDKFRIKGVTDQPGGSESEDMAEEAGFLSALGLVLRLREGGLLIQGPPCSSFVGLNAANCRRSAANGYMGDESYGPVRVGNALAKAPAAKEKPPRLDLGSSGKIHWTFPPPPPPPPQPKSRQLSRDRAGHRSLNFESPWQAAAFLMLLAHRRGARAAVENPPSSAIWNLPGPWQL